MLSRDVRRESFEVTFHASWERVVSLAERLLGDKDLAEDVAQEALARTWKNARSLGSPVIATAFALKVARNLALNWTRDRTRRRDKLGKLPRPENPTPFDEMSLAELEQRIDDVVAGLSSRRQELFELSFLGGLSNREVAARLGLSAQTVANERTIIRGLLLNALAPLLSNPPQ